MGPVFVVEGATPTIALSDIAGGDGNISDTERTAGFDIVGDLGFPGTGATVEVSFNDAAGTTVTVTAGSFYGNVGKWTVSVDPSAPEVPSGDDTLTIDVSASVGAVSATRQTVLGVGTVTVAADPLTAEWDIDPLTVSVNVGTITPTTSKSIASYAINSGELPPGLVFDTTSGEISGTPSEAAAGRTVEVMLTADDGATGVVNIVFPEVVKKTQTLTGFAYTPAQVTFPADVTLSEPAGVQTAVSYATDDTDVCTVDATTGALTLTDAGTCQVTATATGSEEYEEATATASVVVDASTDLATGATVTVAGNTDDYINRAEYESTLTVEGELGVEGVDVELTFDGGRPLTTQTAPDGTTWSVEVTAGEAYTYIEGISEGDPLTLQAVASKAGYADATAGLTLMVDLVDPVVIYTIPALAVGTSVEIDPTTQSDDIATRALDADLLPPGLSFEPTTGRISGAPDTAAAGRTVTVTLTDHAGNTGEAEIVFPPAKDSQTLSGFTYSAANVTVGQTATATAPTGAQNDLSYATDDDGTVCTVDSGTGTVTAVGPGICRVTVTAVGSELYTEATAEAEVNIRSAGDLAGSDALAVSSDTSTDGYINRIGYLAGLTVSGMFAMEDAANVVLTFDRGNVGSTARARTTTTAADGSWSVTVTTSEAYWYIGELSEGALLTLQAVATKAGFVAATVDALVTVDLVDPAATYAPPTALTAGVDITDIVPTSPSSDIASRTISGQPADLVINTGNGRITGAPAAFSASSVTAIVTLTDVAGNEGTTEIVFPAVARQTQDLSGFAYSGARVTLTSGVVVTSAATAPPGAQTALSYATDAAGTVCTVDSGTGAVTAVGWGACRVTVTADEADVYAAATATAEVEIVPMDVDVRIQNDPLVIGPTLRNGGFFILGELGGVGVGATVVLSFDSTPQITVTATLSTRTRGGRYFVGVPARSSYIPSTGSDPLTIVASASFRGATATGALTVATDFVPPPTLTYAIPTVLTAGVDIGVLDSTPPFPSGVNVAFGADPAPGVPPGVEFDVNTNQFKGAPTTFTDAPITYIITLTDAAGNRAVSRIVFPPVVRQTQDLSGFSYSAATVTFPNGATATPPPAAATGLSYATDDDGTVCTVDSGTGAVTAVGTGTCRVTVTATQTSVYASATAEAEVEIVPADLAGSDALIVSSDTSTAGYINRIGYDAGLTVSGMFAMEDAANVVLTFDRGNVGSTARARTTTTAADGSWSVTLTTGNAYWYIGNASEGDQLTLQAIATKAGFVAATVDALVTVDLEDPTVTYNILALALGVSVDIDPTEESTDVSARSAVTGLPANLNFDPATGRISGTPTGSAAAGSVTVTLTDRAGNVGESEIDFPAVGGNTQVLTGFEYDPAQVTFPAVALATAPTGAETSPLTYATGDGAVCTVNEDTGAVTPQDVGTCEVTVTAPPSAAYAQATATAAVTIVASDALDAGATAIEVTSLGDTDGYINRLEYGEGLAVSGSFGVQGANVALTFDGDRTLAATTTSGGGWSVTVASGAAYTYIGDISEGGPLILQAVASRTGYTAATVSVTLTVDLVDPAAAYDIDPLTVSVAVDESPTSQSSDIATRVIGSGRPLGLDFNANTGLISGAPTGAGPAVTVPLTLTDAAGNVGESEIDFPAVVKKTRTLTGFAYTPAQVTFPAVRQATAPTGAPTNTLTYSTVDTGVCDVNPANGAVTPLTAGICRVTVTATGTNEYEVATATATVTVRASNALVNGATPIEVASRGSTDDYINRLEYGEGLTVSGSFGVQGADVELTFDGDRTLAAATTSGGAWSVTVASGAAYTYIGDISEGGPLILQAVASRTGYTAATVSVMLTVDLVDPTAAYDIDPLTVSVAVDESPTSQSSDIATRVIGSGRPLGLDFNANTGLISGAPTGAGSAVTVPLTLTDHAGNEGLSDIDFPAVVKKTRTLTGFAYTPAQVTFPAVRQATAPTGAPSDQLMYSTVDTGVCDVDQATGAVTPKAAGTCRVTVTAPGTDEYEVAMATASVVIEAGVLNGLLTLTSRGNTDGYINRLEHGSGLTVSGSFGVQGADVELTFDGDRTLAATTTPGGTWTVTVASGAAYTYIGEISEGDPLTLQAVATRTGYTAATVSLTLTVDLEDPTVAYTIPPLTAGVSVSVDATSESVDVVSRSVGAGLPPDLDFNTADGAISGTPRGVAAAGRVTVTVTDAAGNVGETAVEVPAVARQTQDLSGFAYPAQVVFPAEAVATRPPGARTPLMYSTVDTGVCEVDPGTGAVTPLTTGTCRVTVTAEETAVYATATAVASVAIRVSNALVAGATTIAVTSRGNIDGYINRLEHVAGLTVSGSFGVQDADVQLTFDGGRPSAATTTSGGAWSVTVASGAAHTYIRDQIPEGDPLILQAVASRNGYTAATVSVTLTVDLVDPAATYNIPALSVGTSVDVSPASESSDVTARVIGAGVPPGLDFDGGTGRIHGTPNVSAVSRAVTVTLTDRAGNMGESTIDFPAVAADTQELTGFEYDPAQVTFPAVAMATAPTGAQTSPLAYATSDVAVCTVNPGTGAVTPLDVGTCEVTVTAPPSAAYAQATATASVTIAVSNALVNGATAIAVASRGNTDKYINRLEHGEGLTVSGSFGVQGADVELTFDGDRTLAATATLGGGWSVTVASGAAYTYIRDQIPEGDPLTLQAVASRTGYTTATMSATLTVDLTDPTATYDIDPLTVSVAVDESPTSQSGDIATRVISSGRPLGLNFNANTGLISGAPSGAGSAVTVPLTLTDAAGNVGESEIDFPAVVKKTRTLTGFAYTPAQVTFPAVRSATAPTGAPASMLTYSTVDTGVCRVDPANGVVTPLTAGVCRVTVTAAGTDEYEVATATASVTILASNALVVGATAIEVTSLGNTDGYINREEHEAGLTVSGSFGVQGADVELTFDGGRPSTPTTTSGGAWSVTVAANDLYIGGISEGDPLTLQAVASGDGYTAATVSVTLTVDLVDPTAAYSFPALSVGTSVEINPTESADVSGRSEVTGLPADLRFDRTNGKISGMLTTVAAAGTVTVTLTDRAGNTGEAEIGFPPVKDLQRLSGFAYSPSTVTFPAGATTTGPTGAQTDLSYATGDMAVCTVNDDTGAVTPLDAGTCRVTVTAVESLLYAEATATATVTIEELDALDGSDQLTVTSLGNSDGYINREEYEAGLVVSGTFGMEDAATVNLTFDGDRAEETTTAADGSWSVEVTTGTPAYMHIGTISEGDPLTLQAVASKAGYSDATAGLTLTVDRVDPAATYNIPALAVGANVDIGPTRESADVSTRSAVTGLPASLSFEPATGRISGTPSGVVTAGTVTVTLTDNAGNTGESEIVFGAVGKGMQTLSGFAYTPSRVPASAASPEVTLTAPTGEEIGLLSYTTDDGTVCTVDSGTGAVTLSTPLTMGTSCRVTVTAREGTNYLEATATATISIVAPGLTPEEQEVVTEAVLSEVGGIAAIQAVDVIGARLGAPGADSAGPGFSLQVGAAHLESTRLDQERAEQMSGWAELVSRDDFDRALLGRSSFSLGSGGEGAAWTLWGKGAYREYERKEGGVETEGEVLSGFVGLDFDRGRLRQGLAVGRSWGDGSFSAGDEESKKGTYELDLTSGYYYLRGRTDFGSLWGLLGAGAGEMRIVNGDQRSAPDLTMQMAAAGAEVELRKGADFDLSARAEGMVTRLESEDALVEGADRVLDGGEYGSQRLRTALEASREIDFESGARARPSAEVGVRYDGGDGVEGAGLELGGGLTFTSGSLTTELHATWLAAHREDLEEWGASASARYGLGGNGRHGLWLGVDAAGGLERGALGLDQAGDPGAWLHDSGETDGDDDAGALFSAEAGYGIGVRGLGLTTPFVRFSSDSSSRRTFSQGLRLRLGGGWLDAELAGSQSRGGGEDDDYSYGIELQARF